MTQNPISLHTFLSFHLVIDSLQKIISVEDVQWHHRKVSISVFSRGVSEWLYTNMKFEQIPFAAKIEPPQAWYGGSLEQ